jgi:hypothetical protein
MELAATFVSSNWLNFLLMCRMPSSGHIIRPNWSPDPRIPRETNEIHVPESGTPLQQDACIMDGQTLRAVAVECGVIMYVIIPVFLYVEEEVL